MVKARYDELWWTSQRVSAHPIIDGGSTRLGKHSISGGVASTRQKVKRKTVAVTPIDVALRAGPIDG